MIVMSTCLAWLRPGFRCKTGKMQFPNTIILDQPFVHMPDRYTAVKVRLQIFPYNEPCNYSFIETFKVFDENIDPV